MYTYLGAILSRVLMENILNWKTVCLDMYESDEKCSVTVYLVGITQI